jgi:hypothetical protein
MGAEAPPSEDVVLAVDLRRIIRRHGSILLWPAFANEPAAAKCCRRLALVARLIRARRNGQCDPDESASIAKLIIADNHAAARREIERLEACLVMPVEAQGCRELDRVIATIEADAGLDPSVTPATPTAPAVIPPDPASVADYAKEMARQKLFRFVIATMPEKERQTAIAGLMADDEQLAQRWANLISAKMRRQRWRDWLPSDQVRSFSAACEKAAENLL